MAPDTTADCAQLSLEAFQEIPCRSGRSGRESDGHREAGVRSLAAALICVFAAAGCAMNPAVDLRVQRGAPTGIAPGERIAILLSRYEKEGVALADSASGSAEQRQRDQIEERLESCLQQSMLAGGSDLAFVSPREARRTLFPGKAISEVPRDPAELLQWAAEAQSNERLALLGPTSSCSMAAGGPAKGGSRAEDTGRSSS
ncbi:MAG: hypothetical protein HYU75_16290 [Betaproteobacteria bacterium]|nr:hypothetical protein [Betaproteobacteria bacterium]